MSMIIYCLSKRAQRHKSNAYFDALAEDGKWWALVDGLRTNFSDRALIAGVAARRRGLSATLPRAK